MDARRRLTVLWAIMRRELLAFFVSPAAYVVGAAWLLICGAQLYLLSSFYAAHHGSVDAEPPLQAFFGQTTLFFAALLGLVPALTMRSLAEERHSGTLEGLHAQPVGPAQIVLGKYMACIVLWLILWAPTLLYVWL
ncbi:MAG: ABC transporter permease subunit, partial [Polyangiales bacterium]